MIRKLILFIVIAAVIAAGVLLVVKKPSGGDDDEGGDVTTEVTVQTGEVTRATLHGYVDGYGTVAGAPAQQGHPAAAARVASAVAGVLVKSYVSEGDTVKRGDRMFDLDDRSALAALERAKRLEQFARDAAQRQRALFEGQNSSTKAVQDAEGQEASAAADLAAAEAQLGYAHIVAPLGGVVTKVNVRTGEAVDTTNPLAEITDLHRLVVSADIPADEAGSLKPGQAVTVLTDPPASATVTYVSPAVEPATNTVTVRAALPEDATLKPGQYVQMRIATEEHKDILAAPEAAVVTDDEGKSVVSVVAGDQATQKEVRTGLRDNGLVEIESEGLKPGDKVVTVGAYGLPEKTKVQIEKPDRADKPGKSDQPATTEK